MRKRIFVGLLLLCSFGHSCLAQKESLLIGPGDMVQVDVLDTPEMSQQVRVTDAGTIPLAYLGSVHIAGETPARAAAEIQQALMNKGVMRHPEVTLRVQEYATQDVSVVGQVHAPGTYAITTPQTVLKIVSLAGGLTEAADRHIVVKRHGSAEQSTYYLSNDPQQALSDMVMVNPGDTVLVSHAPVIYIMGDVSRPGGYAISTNDSHLSLMQAISMAGSANKTSVQSRVRLIRKTAGGQVDIPVRLDRIEKGKEADVALQPNDVIFVPFSWMKNLAMNGSAIAASASSAAIYAIP